MAPVKPALRPLKTSRHMAFPSELYYSPPLSGGCRSDNSSKTESAMQTSMSPPPSYTEFLKALTPVFSPGSAASGTGFPRASSSTSSTASSPRYPSPLSNPSSTTSATFPASSEQPSRGRWQKQKPRHLSVAATAAPTSVQPASPLSAPLSSRPSALTPVARSGRGHYLHPRPPPYKPCLSRTAFAESPRSAASASVARSPYPPPELRVQYVESPRTAERPSSASSSPNIQHVVTTTVTFKRSPPLGPPPRGKRRRSSEERRYD